MKLQLRQHDVRKVVITIQSDRIKTSVQKHK